MANEHLRKTFRQNLLARVRTAFLPGASNVIEIQPPFWYDEQTAKTLITEFLSELNISISPEKMLTARPHPNLRIVIYADSFSAEDKAIILHTNQNKSAEKS